MVKNNGTNGVDGYRTVIRYIKRFGQVQGPTPLPVCCGVLEVCWRKGWKGLGKRLEKAGKQAVDLLWKGLALRAVECVGSFWIGAGTCWACGSVLERVGGRDGACCVFGYLL